MEEFEPAIIAIPPGTIHRGINFGKAVVRHVADGLKKVPEQVAQARLKVCEGCDQRVPGEWVCGHKKCGCDLKVKATWRSERCPLGMWPGETAPVEGKCGCGK